MAFEIKTESCNLTFSRRFAQMDVGVFEIIPLLFCLRCRNRKICYGSVNFLRKPITKAMEKSLQTNFVRRNSRRKLTDP